MRPGVICNSNNILNTNSCLLSPTDSWTLTAKLFVRLAWPAATRRALTGSAKVDTPSQLWDYFLRSLAGVRHKHPRDAPLPDLNPREMHHPVLV
jgi:hypothetical protein